MQYLLRTVNTQVMKKFLDDSEDNEQMTSQDDGEGELIYGLKLLQKFLSTYLVQVMFKMLGEVKRKEKSISKISLKMEEMSLTVETPIIMYESRPQVNAFREPIYECFSYTVTPAEVDSGSLKEWSLLKITCSHPLRVGDDLKTSFFLNIGGDAEGEAVFGKRFFPSTFKQIHANFISAALEANSHRYFVQMKKLV